MKWHIRGPLRQVGWWSPDDQPLPLDAFDIEDDEPAKAAGVRPLLIPDEDWR